MDEKIGRPVITIFELKPKPTGKDPFVVIKAKELRLSKDEEGNVTHGRINDAFPLMGNLQPIIEDSSHSNKYIVCWHDDSDSDFFRSQRKLVGVQFLGDIESKTDSRGKESFIAEFSV